MTAPFTTFLDLQQKRCFVTPVEKLNLWTLVLESQGIFYIVEKFEFDNFLLIVPAHQGIAAYDQLWLCERLEQKAQQKKNSRAPQEEKQSPLPISSIIFSLIITYTFFQWGHLESDFSKLEPYLFSSKDILNGQYYRLASALIIHSDFWHYLSNLFALYFLSNLSNKIYGNFNNLLLILSSGVLGNFFNLLYYHNEIHFSAGSSTAVFGSLGLIAGNTFIKALVRKNVNSNKLFHLKPIIAAIALLSIMGVGDENTDFGAHAFGLLAGILIGIFSTFFHLSQREKMPF